MKISKETKVGVVTAIAIIILAVGYNFIKGKDIFTSSNEYYGKYKKIEGLFKSNPVLVNGYKVGSVSSVKMNNETLELIVGNHTIAKGTSCNHLPQISDPFFGWRA